MRGGVRWEVEPEREFRTLARSSAERPQAGPAGSGEKPPYLESAPMVKCMGRDDAEKQNRQPDLKVTSKMKQVITGNATGLMVVVFAVSLFHRFIVSLI